MALRHVSCVAVFLMLFCCPAAPGAVRSPVLSPRSRPQLWLYYSTNLLVPHNIAVLPSVRAACVPGNPWCYIAANILRGG